MLQILATHMTIVPPVDTVFPDGLGYLFDVERETPLSFQNEGLVRRTGAVTVIDVVESVRFIAEAGIGFVTRWVDFRRSLEDFISALEGCRMVRSSGDGVLVECRDELTALRLAFHARRLVQNGNHSPGRTMELSLRIGIATGDYFVDERDIYGDCVNLASRLAALARPDGIVTTHETATALQAHAEIECEDFGMCFLKHIDRPVHAVALFEHGEAPQPSSLALADARILPKIAVLPLAPRADRSDLVGNIIAEDIIRALSGSPLMVVLSRLSTAAFTNASTDWAGLQAALGADYVIHGSYGHDRDRTAGFVELCDVHSGAVIRQQEFAFARAELVRADFSVFDSFVSLALRAMMQDQKRRLRRQSMPTLQSHSLLLGAISMMHGVSLRDFELAGDALGVLVERHPREALPRAWFACWHSILIAKGRSGDPRLDGLRADEQARRAIDLDPENSLAISVAGLISTNFRKNFDEAERLFEEAIAINPSDSHAVLHKAALHMFTDRGVSACTLAEKATAISPCDPHRYYFDAIAASSAFTAENYVGALDYAAASIRQNKFYTPAWRVRTASLALLDRLDEARQSARELLQIEPGLTIEKWRSRSPAAGFKNGARIVAGLRLAGITE